MSKVAMHPALIKQQQQLNAETMAEMQKHIAKLERENHRLARQLASHDEEVEVAIRAWILENAEDLVIADGKTTFWQLIEEGRWQEFEAFVWPIAHLQTWVERRDGEEVSPLIQQPTIREAINKKIS